MFKHDSKQLLTTNPTAWQNPRTRCMAFVSGLGIVYTRGGP
jgi:hypothetical protein